MKKTERKRRKIRWERGVGGRESAPWIGPVK